MLLRLVVPVFTLWLSLFSPVAEKGKDSAYSASGSQNDVIPADEVLYQQLGEPSIPAAAFKSFLNTYRRLVADGQIINSKVITLIDFTKPSCEERLFVIDPQTGKILYKTLVAHGKNSGEYYANRFSNTPQSHQSSLGFYLTGKPYVGCHGYSLQLDGLEKGINDNARKRAIVIHGASYVSQSFIESNGRLGRSFGCPALPAELAPEIINVIQEGSLLFIYSNDDHYIRNSSFFNSFSSFP